MSGYVVNCRLWARLNIWMLKRLSGRYSRLIVKREHALQQIHRTGRTVWKKGFNANTNMRLREMRIHDAPHVGVFAHSVNDSALGRTAHLEHARVDVGVFQALHARQAAVRRSWVAVQRGKCASRGSGRARKGAG